VSPPLFTLVFDGNCNVCTRSVNRLRKWDRSGVVEMLPSQAADVATRFPWIPADAYADAMQLVAADGTTWQGAAAIEKLLDLVPKGRRISWIFRLPFARPLADRLYRWFARNRYRLGCGAHCQVKER
jgi:predicted DCC family thiol-disulfide oxidoreductase YuxK